MKKKLSLLFLSLLFLMLIMMIATVTAYGSCCNDNNEQCSGSPPGDNCDCISYGGCAGSGSCECVCKPKRWVCDDEIACVPDDDGDGCHNALCGNPCTDCSCFLPGTEITMADGSIKVIEEVSVGDMVQGYDTSSGNYVDVTVLELESPVREDYYTVGFSDGTELELTSEHPLYARSGEYEGWVAIEPSVTFLDASMFVHPLNLGDSVMKMGNTWVVVDSIEHVTETVKTYNLKSVDGPNTYFAGDVLVHNKGETPPPPPPPRCGDGDINQGFEFCDGSDWRTSPNACQRDGNSCRSPGSSNECTCCGDGTSQGEEKCDVGMSNGADSNSDGYIGQGECRTDCTFCGDNILQPNWDELCDLDGDNGLDSNADGVITTGECRLDCTYCGDNIIQSQHAETCDLDGQNGIEIVVDGFFGPNECRYDCTYCGDGVLDNGWDETCDLGDLNNDDLDNSGYFGVDECRLDCTYCGDGVLDVDHGESCDPGIVCPLGTDACSWSNYADWKDSGYYPGCRDDCTACGDGELDIDHGEQCDDIRAPADQTHTSLTDDPDFWNNCPGSCKQPSFITGEASECICGGEECNKVDDNYNCHHCEDNIDNPEYFSALCWNDGSTTVWNIHPDSNEDGQMCDCCLFGTTGCCDDETDDKCLSEKYRPGEWVCDGGVDEGFAWIYRIKQPDVFYAVLTDIDSVDPTVTGTDVTSEMKDCESKIKTEIGDYIYLSWNDLFQVPIERTVPGTEFTQALEFGVTIRTRDRAVAVDWFNVDNDAWEEIPGCGPFSHETVTRFTCPVPDGLVQAVDGETFLETRPIIRLRPVEEVTQ